jgi:translation initiation factor 4E
MSKDNPLATAAQAKNQKPAWTLWYMARTNKHSQNTSSYENYVNPVCTVDSVDSFVRIWSHIHRPSTLPASTDLHLFKEGIKPVWEDPNNEQGGRWVLRLQKGLADRLWEHLGIAIVSGLFEDNKATATNSDDLMCGVVIGVRYQEDVVSIWTRNSSDVDGNVRVKERFLNILQLPTNTLMEYKPHDTTKLAPNQTKPNDS